MIKCLTCIFSLVNQDCCLKFSCNFQDVPPYSIKTPDQKLIQALDIIKKHKGKLTKKEVAKIAEKQELITINAMEKNQSQARFASLDKNIIQPLEEQWKFIEVEKIGRNRCGLN